MREIKKFADKKIIIRSLSREDLKHPEKFQKYINSLIKERNNFVTFKKLKTIGDEKSWIKNTLKLVESKKMVIRIAECKDKIIAEAAVMLLSERRDHIGELGISVIKNYRGIGVGKYLISKIIDLAFKELCPKPEIIKLSTVPKNKKAISFYKKLGFKKVAIIPDQIKMGNKILDETIMLLYKNIIDLTQ